MRGRAWLRWGGGIAGIIALAGATAFYVSDKIYLRADHAAITASDFDRKLSAPQLRADFKMLLQTVEHVHPDFNAVVDRARYEQRAGQVLGALDRPMTRIEFWRVASSINGQFRDGHTSLRTPEEEYAAVAQTVRVLPMDLRLDDHGITVARSFDRSVPDGARLVSINGIAAPQLRDDLTNRVSGESLMFRRSHAADRFARSAWLLGIRSPFTVVWSDETGRNESVTMRGIAAPDLERLQGTGRDQPFQLDFDGQTAVLTVSSFEEPRDEFSTFLERAFAEIARRRAKAVILDIRQNGGGASSQGDLLQSYLSDSTLPALRDVTVKTTREVKARYRTLMPPGFRWIPINALVPTLRGIQTTADNGFYTFHPEAALATKRSDPKANAFKEPLFLLIGPGTYSSAAIFAAPLSYWKRAVLVGQPTGEPLTFFGDNYEFDLPASKLQASVSHKRFRLLANGDPTAGLKPTIAVPLDQDALLIAKQLARSAR